MQNHAACQNLSFLQPHHSIIFHIIITMAFLCLRCRQDGHITSECVVSGDYSSQSVEEPSLQLFACHQDLCTRCEGLNIVEWMELGDIKDERPPEGFPLSFQNEQHNHDQRILLGVARSIILNAECPLCRLIFRVFPCMDDEEFLAAEHYLVPVRSYNRFGLVLDASVEKEKYAVYVAVEGKFGNSSYAQFLGEPGHRLEMGVGKQIALSSHNANLRRPACSARERSIWLDMDVAKGWLRQCETEHDHGLTEWNQELTTCMMIDVEDRKIVPCPQDCRYIALSYVWGGVSPEPGALESKTLPQTIEDAITVTQLLGERYLWVDALCIDQTPSPWKTQQLSMMDIIYSCSCLTIVALASDRADSGLRGVSPYRQRADQGKEIIDGHEVLVVYPSLSQEVNNAVYSTRAWTFQEFTMSPRKLIFGRDQVAFVCSSGKFYEAVDYSCVPSHLLTQELQDSLVELKVGEILLRITLICAEYSHMCVVQLDRLPSNAELRSASPERMRHMAGYLFSNVGLEEYTRRQMSNDSDSLNAFMGMLSGIQRSLLPQGFIWGLPLHDFPTSLRWYHVRGQTPRRRLGFPSWSYVGWEGTAAYTDFLDIVGHGFKERECMRRHEESTDLVVNFMLEKDQVLTLEAHLIQLEIRNEPFNNAYISDTDTFVGMLEENSSLHKNTLPAGVFSFLVVERLTYRKRADGPLRDILFLLFLESGDGGLFTRRSMVRLYVEPELRGMANYEAIFGSRQEVQLA